MRECPVIMSFVLIWEAAAGINPSNPMRVLNGDTFKHYVDFLNAMEPENIVNCVANSESWAWMKRIGGPGAPGG